VRQLLALLLALAATVKMATAQPRVTFPGPAGVSLTAFEFVPERAVPGRRPAIVALHGCGGNVARNGEPVARVADWSARWTAAGYVVLWPDSFGSRGLGPQCQVQQRSIRPLDRADDALAALAWLAARPDIDPARIALVGWSNGGGTVLHATGDRLRPPAGLEFKLAIAFYPGCRPIAESRRPWAPRVPLTILMGGADDWTPPAPCRVLGARPNVRYLEYPGAYHDFDTPDLPVRKRRNLTYTADGSGIAHVGTDPAGRAAAIAEVSRLLATAFQH
jgi:dienelactone hydrolase